MDRVALRLDRPASSLGALTLFGVFAGLLF
jgi:hypothetical protein